jgi:hypothetical protein
MTRTAYLSVLCDADWGINPPCRILPHPGDLDDNWQALLARIPVLRQRLARSPFVSRHGALPLTWLLRADRQVLELHGDAAYYFRRFEPAARSEQAHGSEIGWHPHLYRWEESSGRWRSYLREDDDLEVLAESLEALRQLADVRGVRTGWDYHSNRLMAFFDSAGLLADASAIPGSVHGGDGFHDWRGAPRQPYSPARSDYRRPAASPDSALRLVEMPVLARALSLPTHIARYGLRVYRALTKPGWSLPDWTSSAWQGVLVSRDSAAFSEAVRQTLTESANSGSVFLTTYFHLRELLSDTIQELLVHNLENVSARARHLGYSLRLTTLSAAAAAAKQQLLSGT